MIKGLDKFKEQFSALGDQYVLIGGTPTYLLLLDAGIERYVTKDLDIVLSLEFLDEKFGRMFWDFVREAGYKSLQTQGERPVLYRFSKPENNDFPSVIELFSRSPDNMNPPENFRFTSIPIDENISSLSAILLDDVYYEFLHKHKATFDKLSIVGVHGLIPLKAIAWLNLTAQKAAGETVKGDDLIKHRSDILRLHRLLTPTETVNVPDKVKEDLEKFLDELLKAKDDLNLSQLGLGKDSKLEDIIAIIKQVYGLA